MRRFISLLLCVITAVTGIFTFSACSVGKLQKFTEYYFDYFDTATTIIGYEKTEEEFKKVAAQIETQLKEYHQLYNIYSVYEGVNNICALNIVRDGAHRELKVDRKIIDLLLFSKEMYAQTQGKVNIAMGSVLSIWHDYRTKGMENASKAELPPKEKLEEASKHTNIDDVIIDEINSTVFLKDPLMTLDVGAVAKGYAVEEIGKYLKSKGITGYLLNVGGNVKAVSDENSQSFEIGIENPDGDENNPFIKRLTVTSESVVTSGSYQRFYVVNGKNYHHLIDPETLYPGENFKSVSVITEDSAKADAYSTSLFLMTYEEGKQFIEDKAVIQVIWVKNSGEVLFS